jgi:hypothetical protein
MPRNAWLLKSLLSLFLRFLLLYFFGSFLLTFGFIVCKLIDQNRDKKISNSDKMVFW